VVYAPYLFTSALKLALGVISAVAGAASSVLNALGLSKAGGILGIIGAAASFGTSLLAAKETLFKSVKAILQAVSAGATLVSRTLSAFGHRMVAQIFGLVSSVTDFIQSGLREAQNKIIGFHHTAWETYKFVRQTAEQVANLAGESRVAGFLNTLGLVDDAGDLYLGIRDFNKSKDAGSRNHPREDLNADVRRFGVLVTGPERDHLARRLRLRSRLTTLRGLVGNVNSIFGRVDRGIALAH
jgi:hypothetical protein